MNTNFLWPAIGMMAVYTISMTVQQVRALNSGIAPHSSPADTLLEWGVLLGAAVFGYLTAGIVGFILTAVACFFMPVMITLVIAILTGRVRRR